MKTYDDCIIFLLAKAYQKAHGDFKKRLHTYSLTPMQHLILEALRKEEGLSASDIGNKLVLDGATLSGVLDRLTLGGWILKKSDVEDKRVNLTFLPSLLTIDYPAYIKVCIEEVIKFIETAGRNPEPYMEQLKSAGIKVVHKCTRYAMPSKR